MFINLIYVCIINMVEEEIEKRLRTNIHSFLNSARLVYESRDFTSAVVLYFKTLFAVFDIVLLRDKGVVPKDHSDRFRMLEKNFPEFYLWLDKNYEVYRNSYRITIEKEACDKIKKYAERIIEEQKI